MRESGEPLLTVIKAEKEELESLLNEEKLLSLRVKQELSEAEAHNTDLYKVKFCQDSRESCV